MTKKKREEIIINNSTKFSLSLFFKVNFKFQQL